jgi:hypothetical protein
MDGLWGGAVWGVLIFGSEYCEKEIFLIFILPGGFLAMFHGLEDAEAFGELARYY